MSGAHRASSRRSNSRIIIAGAVLLAIGCALGGMRWLGRPAQKTHRDSSPSAGRVTPNAQSSDTVLRSAPPIRDGPAREVFLEALPNFVVALDSWRRKPEPRAPGETNSYREQVLRSARTAHMPEPVVSGLAQLLKACTDAAVAETENLDAAADQISRRVIALNEALAEGNWGFLVESEVLSRSGGRSVLLFSFEVLRVILYRSRGHDIRTMRVRRLDKLNWSYRLLGFTSPRRRDAVVLDSKIDALLLALLPALSEEVQFDPFGLRPKAPYTTTTGYTKARRRAVSVTAAELGKAGPDMKELSLLIGRRQKIYEQWNELLASRHLSIDVPNTVAVTWNYREQMEGLATRATMDALDKIGESLATEKMLRAFATASDLFAQSATRHEAQHRLDFAKIYSLPMPEELSVYVGPLPGGRAWGALAELSAYLSELARDSLMPRTNLSLLTAYLFDERAWGMDESYAALVIFEGLARELAIAHPPLTSGSRINRDAVATLYLRYTTLDSDTLRHASERLWARLFGLDLPVLKRITE